MFLLIGAALPGTQGFEDLAFAISLMIFAERLLAEEFEPEYVGVEFLAEEVQVFAENGSELEFGGGASGLERSGIKLRGVGQGAFQLRECFLGAGDLEIGLAQFDGPLAFDALAEAE
ncbi:MAG TPA: hypothetical protein VH157_06095 [Bryobacteraceae bacterium]|nr:hypothetical protein [Bryobacteraceae bacterium]